MPESTGPAAGAGGRGFTLLEVLIALAVLSGVVVTVITVMNTHLAASARLSDRTDAALVARERIEYLLLKGVPSAGAKDAPGETGYAVTYTVEDAQEGLEKICAAVEGASGERARLCAWAEKRAR